MYLRGLRVREGERKRRGRERKGVGEKGWEGREEGKGREGKGNRVPSPLQSYFDH